MSIRIQVPELKGYKAIKNPTLTTIIDNTINNKWWNDEGWSTMYDALYQEFYDLLKSGDFLKNRLHLAGELISKPGKFDEDLEDKERLKQVFAFLEKHENKPDPTDDKRNNPELALFEKDNTIIVGNKGFSIVDKSGRYGDEFANRPQAYPYPCDGVMLEYLGEEYPIVEDILDGGVFVLKTVDDMLEVYKSKDIDIDNEQNMYLV